MVAGLGHRNNVINFNRARFFNDLCGHNFDVLTIKKIVHPVYGECLITNSDEIKLWAIKKWILYK